MTISKSAMRELNTLSGTPRRQFGRMPNQPKQSVNKALPTNMIFFIEDTQDVFPLNSSGAVQFLRKCQFPSTQDNVEWVLDVLLDTPIMESADLNGVMCGISCEMARDPGNISLSQMGIAKSMVSRPMRMMPTQSYQQDYNDMPVPPAYGNSMNKCVVAYGVQTNIPNGQGVDFGRPTMEVYNDRVMKYRTEEARRRGGTL